LDDWRARLASRSLYRSAAPVRKRMPKKNRPINNRRPPMFALGVVALVHCGGVLAKSERVGPDPETGGMGPSTGSGDRQGSGGSAQVTGGTGMTVGSAGSSNLDWAACDGPGQCAAVLASCCGKCGAGAFPDVSAYIGVNQALIDTFRAEHCAQAAQCETPACLQNPLIAAKCVDGRCDAFDVRQVPAYSACQTDQDCKLRSALGCCTVCIGQQWVAVRSSAEQAIKDAMCAPNVACPDCQPTPPANAVAICLKGSCTMGYDSPIVGQ
jgi:hypothetical protein